MICLFRLINNVLWELLHFQQFAWLVLTFTCSLACAFSSKANSIARPQTDVRFDRILSLWGADGFARVRSDLLGRACAHRAAAPQITSALYMI